MRVTKKENTMILGISSNVYNDNVYYNADVYDMAGGSMYRCSITPEMFNHLSAQQKPLMVNECTFDILAQYKGASRLELVALK